ncbi:TDT family transporter [Bacillus thermotolerans]|uniref:Uncharacterized protein n=1 Tax=Bacillus thermotolerans TaxID=1221996 RepID=A0A0F5HK35_BACTR|nr:hypothetical protein [Bacillus thermotolerans]KKB33603.1 hypothetical protein QY97_03170 [Bacillus thermotolerans]KKB41750.1 hypothetical protein QY95_00557 [Bacillus thermotolerans]
MFFLIAAACLAIMIVMFIYKIFIKTSTMALVMAAGILLHGVLFHLADRKLFILQWLSAWTIALWVLFAFSILLSFLYRQFGALHIVNPINRFGIGTWVAGTSIISVLIYEQFEGWQPFAVLLSYANIGLWLFYLLASIQSFYKLRQSGKPPYTHGILLLTTVSTQSIVLLLNTVHTQVPPTLDAALIATGLFFYAISFAFIIHDCFRPGWTIEDHWSNTNCIIHGALSITGFACLTSDAVSMEAAESLWAIATAAFLIIETIEFIRLVKRLKRYSFKEGIWTYNVTQWSRLFTFGMFYTFTSLVTLDSPFLSIVQTIVLLGGPPVIILLFAIEAGICLPSVIKEMRVLRKKQAA